MTATVVPVRQRRFPPRARTPLNRAHPLVKHLTMLVIPNGPETREQLIDDDWFEEPTGMSYGSNPVYGASMSGFSGNSHWEMKPPAAADVARLESTRSIAAWITVGDTSSNSAITHVGDESATSQLGIIIYTNNSGQFVCKVGDGGTGINNRRQRTTTKGYSQGDVIFVCGVVPEGTTDPDCYVNGVLDNGDTSSNGSGFAWGTSDLIVGDTRFGGSTWQQCTGSLGPIMYFDKQLTAGEVMSLYNPITRWDMWATNALRHVGNPATGTTHGVVPKHVPDGPHGSGLSG